MDEFVNPVKPLKQLLQSMPPMPIQPDNIQIQAAFFQKRKNLNFKILN